MAHGTIAQLPRGYRLWDLEQRHEIGTLHRNGMAASAMLDLNDLRLFVHVVDCGGLARAAQALGVPTSTVSRRLAGLEQHLGLRLIHRNAKTFALTEGGEEIYRHCLDFATAARTAEGLVAQHAQKPGGRVRLSCSVAFGQVVLPELLTRFSERFPNVRLMIDIANRPADSVNEGFDVLLRAHTWPLPDSSLIQRSVCVVPMITVASPAYLDQVGRPRTPGELAALKILAFGFKDEVTTWEFRRADAEPEHVAITPRLQANEMVALQRLLLLHGGVGQLPDYLCRADLRAGRLERVLPEWSARESIATVMLPARLGVAPGARALADFIVAELPAALGAIGDR